MSAVLRGGVAAFAVLLTSTLAIAIFLPVQAAAGKADRATSGTAPAASPGPTASPTAVPATSPAPTASPAATTVPTPGSSNPRSTAPVYPAHLKPSPDLPHGPQLLEAASAAGATGPSRAGANSADVETLSPRAQASQAQGVDVADFQDTNAPIQWSVVASQYQFAFVKATEGNYYKNPFYVSDSAAALAAGLYVGAYEFAAPDRASGPTEANYFLQQSGYVLRTRILFPMVDLETDPYNSSTPCYGLTPSGLISWISSYSNTIYAALGVRPIIYTAAGFWNQCTGGTSAFRLNPLWVASYGTSTPTLPAGFPDWVIWQYGVGSAAGITGPADLDTFNGTVAQLASQLTDPGGNLTASGPGVTSPQRGRLDVFYRGAGGVVLDRVDRNGALSTVSLGGGVAPRTSPAAVSWGPGRMDVFVEGTDDGLWHDSWNGSGWSGWSSLGGALGSSPTVASWGAGRLDVFAAGTDFSIWHRAFAGAWWPWQPNGGALSPGTAPSAASWGPGRIDLFLTAPTHQLWHQAWTGRWTAWQGLGGYLTSGPGVASWGLGDLHVFGAGGDHALWETYWPGGAWSPWLYLNGALAAAPSATSEGPGTVEVTIRGTNSALWLLTWGASGQVWSSWEGLGGALE